MGASKHFKRLMFEREITTGDIAKLIDKPLQSLYNQICRDSWKYKEVEEIADKLGCDIVFVDRKTGQKY